MGFLIKMALCLIVVILLIPADEQETRKLADGRALSWAETFVLATTAYEDASGFCTRHHDACDTGGIALSTFGAKARTGARWIYSYFDPQAGKPAAAANAPSSQPMPSPIGSLRKPEASPFSTGSIHARRQAQGPVVPELSDEPSTTLPRGKRL